MVLEATASALDSEKLRKTISGLIRALLLNKKKLNLLTQKTIGKSGDLAASEINPKNSLKKNLELLINNLELINEAILKNSDAIDKITKKVDRLMVDYNRRTRTVNVVKRFITKLKPLIRYILKYTLKSTITRIAVYLSLIAAGSPEVLKFLNYIGELIGAR